MKNLNKLLVATTLALTFASAGAYAESGDSNGLDNVEQTQSYKAFASQFENTGSVEAEQHAQSVKSDYDKYHRGEITADGQWRNDN